MKTRPMPSAAACSAALLALSVAVCVGGTAGLPGSPGSAGHPGSPTSPDRRVADEHEQMVVAIIACLNDAAKHLAGPAVAVVDGHGPALPTPLPPTLQVDWPGQAPVITSLPHVSRLNLPPPAALS